MPIGDSATVGTQTLLVSRTLDAVVNVTPLTLIRSADRILNTWSKGRASAVASKLHQSARSMGEISREGILLGRSHAVLAIDAGQIPATHRGASKKLKQRDDASSGGIPEIGFLGSRTSDRD